jgi:predicted HAD superfamily phosphohydrolase
MDSGSGSDWLTRVDGELLYTQPNEHDLGIAEAIGFDKGYKAATAKTLTDEEIKEAKREALKEYYSVLSYQDEFELSWIDELFARAILRKAQEK